MNPHRISQPRYRFDPDYMLSERNIFVSGSFLDSIVIPQENSVWISLTRSDKIPKELRRRCYEPKYHVGDGQK